MRGLIAIVAATQLLGGSASADGLIYQLPDDTSWVLYKIEGLKDKTKRGGQVEQFAGQFKVSSVGTVTVQGEKCRWIEMEHSYRRTGESADDERGKVYKLLIPEKHLTRGQSPVNHIHRGWVTGLGKFAGGAPRKIERADALPISKSEFDLQTQFYLDGPSADVRALDPEVIESKLGMLKCAGVSGTLDVSSLPNPENIQLKPPCVRSSPARKGAVRSRVLHPLNPGTQRQPSSIEGDLGGFWNNRNQSAPWVGIARP